MDSRLEQAKEWARDNIDDFYEDESVYAVCEVILSLPGHWIDADKLRQIIDFQGASISEEARKDIESLLAPPLPTLAELIEAGNDPKQYQWMQADHIENGRVIITHPGSTYIHYMKASGLSGGVSHSGADRITPLPDLPRLEWPGSGDDPTVAEQENVAPDQQVNPQVNLDSSLPRPEDVPAGEPWLVKYDGREWVGIRSDHDFRPWSIICMDGAGDLPVNDSDITLVSRLVPENKENA